MPARTGRSVWAFISFLALFCFLLGILTKIYLLRALMDFNGSDARGRKLIAAHALLLMSAVLAILGLSWVMIFRIGRYFFPRQGGPREPKTKYTDAWSESAKRMRTPDE